MNILLILAQKQDFNMKEGWGASTWIESHEGGRLAISFFSGSEENQSHIGTK
jgi:hypothetical protein